MVYPSIDRFNILNVRFFLLWENTGGTAMCHITQQFSSCKMVQVKFSGCYGKPIN